MKNVATGIDDFKILRENNYLYIDKTLLIKEIIDEFDKPCLIPRPRRFGKTLNMSMLYYYFSLDYKNNNLFNGLKIMEQGDKYLSEMNKYPVISLSLKNTKFDNYEGFIDNYKDVMKSLYGEYEYLLESDKLDETEKKDFLKITKKEENILLPNALSKLVSYLKKHYNKEVIVLLDEYDAPILNGYLKGYYDKIIAFMKQLFVTTFKNNMNLKKCVITGILRVSKENLFSDANNINVYNMTDSKYSNYFGFTEDEVIKVLKEYKLENTKEEVKKWYDGYLFGNTTIYNPVSILNYLEKRIFEPYWTNTGGVDLLKNLIYRQNKNTSLLNEFHELLETNLVQDVNLDLYMDLKNLEGSRETIWTLFMLSGYLTLNEYTGSSKNITLKIPNKEVKENLESIASKWFIENGFDSYDFSWMLSNNNIEEFKNSFKEIVVNSLSYYDVPSTNNGENFYHAFAMGLLYTSNKYYYITSNRESGYGRYDLMLKPKIKDIPAYIIEFKLVRDNDFEKVIEDGFKQIEENNYIESIKDYEVIKMVIAFRGKRVEIETR